MTSEEYNHKWDKTIETWVYHGLRNEIIWKLARAEGLFLGMRNL